MTFLYSLYVVTSNLSLNFPIRRTVIKNNNFNNYHKPYPLSGFKGGKQQANLRPPSAVV